MRFIPVSNAHGFSGYSKAIRELSYAIFQRGVEVALPYSQTGGYLPEKCYPLLKSNVQSRDDDVIFIRPLFDDVGRFSDDKKLVGNLALESSRLPERIVKECNLDKFKQIWVPSKYVYYIAVDNNIIEDKLRIVPHGYDPEIFKFKKRDVNDIYTFLFVGGYTGRGDRKGADLLAQTFNEEFKEDDVKLLFKINTTYGDFPVKDLVLNDKIHYITDNLLDKDMINIYNSGDCLISPSHGEAFNMTVLEAIACGLPVATTMTGERDYCEDCGIDIEIPIRNEIPARYSPWDNGMWKKPSLIREALRYLYDTKPKKKKYKNIGNWTWNKASRKAINYLEEI